MSEATPTIIDGSHLGGGGQVLRNAFAYSALLKKPIRVENVRANRTPSGLRPQHATGIGLISRISSGSTLEGATKGSSTVEFHPGEIAIGKAFEADPQTAGSTTLLLQISLPCLLFRNPIIDTSPAESSKLKLRGGTNATLAPPIDFATNVFLPFIARHFDLQSTLDIVIRGYYPRGGGEINVSIPSISGPIQPIHLVERGSVTRIKGRSYVAGVLPTQVVQETTNAAKERLVEAGYSQSLIDIEEIREPMAVGSGHGILLWADTDRGCTLSGGAIGEKGKNASTVGEEAADELIANLAHGGCVDEYLQDQVIILMTLAEGRSVVSCGPISLHTRTAIWVAEQMTGAKFEVEDRVRGGVIACEGIGYR